MGRILTYVEYVGGGIAAATAIGIVIYLGSFVLMRAHVEPRPFGAMLRELIRETWWVVLTQPLVPLYYVRGRRMGGDGPGDPIVFVHGYFQNRSNFVGIARAIRRAGVAPMFGFNYPWLSSVEKNAVRLARFVETVCKATGKEHVSLVAHSLGGLIALEYMHGELGAKRVRRCVTIASPHGGVAWRGPILGEVGGQMRLGSEFLTGRAGRTIAVPTLSIYSTHDNMVYPFTTSQLATRGARDLAVKGVGHLTILFDPGVAKEIVAFLGSA